MTMRPFYRPATFSPAGLMPWMRSLAIRMLARSLKMPEPLVYDTGVFVFAQVQAVESRAVKTLCPVRLFRLLQTWFRRQPR
jgi:hypothetical protein